VTAAVLLPGGCSASAYKEDADAQVYDILGRASRRVTGEQKVWRLERPVDTLRSRLLGGHETVELGLADALDVAAENSRDFQRQKEQLYQVALALTAEQHNFAVRFGGGGTANATGTGNESGQLTLSDDLSASRNTESGGRIVASFVNTWLRTLFSGGGDFTGSSILGLTFTQPLLRGFGQRIAREPLTQAERDVIYQVRDFERFRATFAVTVASDYLNVLETYDNLDSEKQNLASVIRTREQFEEETKAGKRAAVDVDRAKQDELTAADRLASAEARYESALDRFKQTLGLPTLARLQLNQQVLDRIRALGVRPVELSEEQALGLALRRRYDHRNVVDNVEDAARRIFVAEDALRSQLDFSSALTVPTEPNNPLKFDWDKVRWAAGFDLNLALDRLFERNAYRTSLINFDVAVRAREQSEDQVQFQVREAMRSIHRTIQSFRIQTEAVVLAERRVDSTTELNLAGRATALDLLDSKQSLLDARLSAVSALVDYAVARMQLMRDLEGLALEPLGLRFDLALPVPTGPLPEVTTTEDNPPSDPPGASPALERR
jgi:outer membrane protein TolC